MVIERPHSHRAPETGGRGLPDRTRPRACAGGPGAGLADCAAARRAGGPRPGQRAFGGGPPRPPGRRASGAARSRRAARPDGRVRVARRRLPEVDAGLRPDVHDWRHRATGTREQGSEERRARIGGGGSGRPPRRDRCGRLRPDHGRPRRVQPALRHRPGASDPPRRRGDGQPDRGDRDVAIRLGRLGPGGGASRSAGADAVVRARHGPRGRQAHVRRHVEPPPEPGARHADRGSAGTPGAAAPRAPAGGAAVAGRGAGARRWRWARRTWPPRRGASRPRRPS